MQYVGDEATHSGPLLADVTCPDGLVTVTVTVDPAVTSSRVRVFTEDVTDSPAADAVRGARIRQDAERLVVKCGVHARPTM